MRARAARGAAGIVVISLAAACGAETPPAGAPVVVVRPLGAWEGTGTRTMGDVPSESGRFRIHWETRLESGAGEARFTLTVRSAVSGRPIEVAVDHRGEGSGVVDFADGPRIYDFLVESTGVRWAFRVEETYTQP